MTEDQITKSPRVIGLLLAAAVTVIFVAIVATLASAAPVDAQSTGRNCAPRDTVVDRLNTEYSERRHSIGLGANNQVMEIFASDGTGTWTIIVTMPNGLTCLVASGQAFEDLDEALPGMDEEL